MSQEAAPAASRVSPDKLLDFATAIYVKAGMPHVDARLAADTLVQADLWGHQSHGVLRLPWYVGRLRAGVCDPVARPEFVVDGGAIAVMDGHDAMGQVLTARAMEDAIRRARAHGIGAVVLRNSNHFGTAMYFTPMAARAGCVAFLSTNASPAMAPWGGRRKAVGNQSLVLGGARQAATPRWCWTSPTGRRAREDLPRPAERATDPGRLGHHRGRSLDDGCPGGDRRHHPADGPAQGLRHRDHDGHAVRRAGRQRLRPGRARPLPDRAQERCGAVHDRLDIAAFQPIAEFAARMEALVAELKGVPLAQGFQEIFYPGEIEARNDAEKRVNGLVLPADTLADLAKLANEYQLDPIC